MIKLPNVRLPSVANARLQVWQSQVDAAGDYAAQVLAAKDRFTRYANSAAFDEVRRALARLCHGPRRCCYCEDSVADEIEHIKPKDLYPELVFVWLNYLYACGRCNGGKRHSFAIFSAAGEVVNITRPRQALAVAPPPGLAVLIDPRGEDALQYLQLDLRATFKFVPLAAQGSREFQRAEYTINVLKLNDRDELLRARRRAYENYRARLHEYLEQRRQGASTTRLRRFKSGLQREGHPTVWAEMKRQQARLPELKQLFAAVPEALGW